MTKENLILDANSPEQFVTYNAQRIAFYDGQKAGEYVLYICIINSKDNFSVVKRRAKDRFVNGQSIPETKLYARAYAKYLEFKKASKAASEEIAAKNEALEKKVKELEEKVKKEEESEKEVKASKAKKPKKVEKIEEDVKIEEEEGVAEPVLTIEE